MADSRVYFAAKNRKEIGPALVGKLEQLKASKYDTNAAEYANAYRHYYGKESGFGLTWGVTRAGAKGELAAVRINRARALAKALLAIVVGPKVQWRPQARNSDAGAAAATTLAFNILQDFWETKGLASVYKQWVEQAIAFSQAFVFDEWDEGAGPPLLAMGNQLRKQGDIVLHNLLPWDVKVDPSCTSYKETTWRFVRLWKNKFDLAAGNPQLADGRQGEEAREAILATSATSTVNDFDTGRAGDDSDLVPVWYFFHDKTPSLPAGRETIFISGDVVLRDGRLSYDAVPVHRLAADEMFGTPNGWSSFWDTLGIQEISDAINTTLSTIITTLGNPSIAAEQGTEIDDGDLVNGFQVIRHPRGSQPPKPIQFAEFPPDALKYDDKLAGEEQSMMGLNDAARGQPEGKEMNAQAFALLASMATQNASPLQTDAIGGLGRVGTSVLKTSAKRISRERELKITGKSSKNLYAIQRYSGKDLRPVDGVVVHVGDALEQTPAGRLTILEKMMTIPGAVTTPEAMFEVAETGRLEPAIRAQRDELLLLKSEFEMLQEGQNPPVHSLHKPPLHYRENGAVLYNPEALGNPAVLKAANDHLDQHYLEHYGVARAPKPPDPMVPGDMGYPGDPLRYVRECFLMGRPPDPSLLPAPMGFAQPPGMGPPPMGGTAPPPPGGPADGTQPPVPGAPSPAPPPEARGGPPSGPPVSMPPNPLTGQPFDHATGGGVVQPS